MALDINWSQRAGNGALPRGPEDFAYVYNFKSLLGGEEPITTRLLFECAGMMDEAYQFKGSRDYVKVMDPSLRKMWGINWSGPYGEPHRVASRMAGRQLSHSEVLTLIDFALNPPLPGLQKGVTSVDWREIYPPYRFIFAASIMGDKGNYSHEESVSTRPDAATVKSFFDAVTEATSIRMGVIDSKLSSDSTIRDTALAPKHFSERIPGMTLLFSERLQEERTQDIRSISHFGSLWINVEGIRLLRHTDSDFPWWFFPPLQVADHGEFKWTSDRLDIDEATDLCIGSAISSAYDDIVHRVGPLTCNHLPASIFDDTAELNALNYVLKNSTRMSITWPS
ncbi:hypothetical protein G3I40_44495 [Streptomyces sp. SID14478]|uniref:hypothetical protein n=1 Tax=Streptomyces sp. SID14478 TaxID=2706073 RepID=UPI0013E03F93|nr:hypothetical protein [Streptomyces sp. SID14478]NEB82226.1 hypothetical protein [Streptomyces sp. SID14478]